jgi:hypothetical protein
MPLFDYEKTLFDTLQQHKHVWIKKATGLGVTEFMLWYMAWLCFQDQRKLPGDACFNSLSVEERAAFEEAIPLITRGQASTIEELCEFLETLDPLGQEIAHLHLLIALLIHSVFLYSSLEILSLN